MTEYNIEQLPYNIQRLLRPLGNHWIWIGGITDPNRKDPKGRLRFNGKMEYPHRVVFHLLTGFDLNSELQVNHKPECLDSLCCHPNCLYAGTQQDNMDDRKLLGNHSELRKTHCPQGHEYNTSPTSGHRYCPTCKNKRRDEWRAKQRGG